MADEIREECEQAGGAHSWQEDDIGPLEVFEWEGPSGDLRIEIDSVYGVRFLAEGELQPGVLEVVSGEVEGVDHLRALIAWTREGGEIPES